MAVVRGEKTTKTVKGFTQTVDESAKEAKQKLFSAITEYFGMPIHQFQLTVIADPKPEMKPDEIRVLGAQGGDRDITRGEFASMIAGTVLSWYGLDQIGAAIGMAHAIEQIGLPPIPSKPHPSVV